MSRVVYTAISEEYDDLKPQAQIRGLDYVAFFDRELKPPRPWRVCPLPSLDHEDPCRRAKLAKVLAHVVLPETEFSLWIDGSFRLVNPRLDFQGLIRRYLAKADIAVFRHRKRDCIFEEAKVIAEDRRDDPDVVQRQMERYRSENFPERAGLVQGGIILRRHTPAIAAFNEAWWQEIQGGSRRDQLSFPYVARKLGLRYAELAPEVRFAFRRSQHRKRGLRASLRDVSER